ncbi:hypothetical protein T12_541 [Trichinella patagoniensis]|uniref:Uncharacterized protein n=2 Tax=Trichinella TaxID=6333 RepID=A0A0V0Z9G0_9BILA|nr:hypothetical protein T12_541 [Trichinella patagoniensis]
MCCPTNMNLNSNNYSECHLHHYSVYQCGGHQSRRIFNSTLQYHLQFQTNVQISSVDAWIVI